MTLVKTTKSRRLALSFAATDVIILGLVIHFFVPGDFASLIADALYTVMVYLVLAVFLPRAKRTWLALAAFAISALIELAQLTGVPEQLAVSFPASRLIFGTTFSALDLVAYAVGAVAVYYADTIISARLSARSSASDSASDSASGAQWRPTQPE
ncbi:DUF2809 domain-containing protein [Specibacter sp. NPDC078692]|uniref:ribosomal maturation YjgA family protein n=1 Tax=Specibacter sp. NPDC078692 TaxID=3155818 RepID=UPI003433D488